MSAYPRGTMGWIHLQAAEGTPCLAATLSRAFLGARFGRTDRDCGRSEAPCEGSGLGAGH